MKLLLDEEILKSGIKKGYIAKQLEINPVTLSNYISGKRKISLEMTVKLATILNCKVDDLYKR